MNTTQTIKNDGARNHFKAYAITALQYYLFATDCANLYAPFFGYLSSSNTYFFYGYESVSFGAIG